MLSQRFANICQAAWKSPFAAMRSPPCRSAIRSDAAGLSSVVTAASDQFGTQIENEFGRLLPTEAFDNFGEVAKRKQVLGKAEEAGLDGAFVEQRQDLILMM